jgi:ankyrin repeat protein
MFGKRLVAWLSMAVLVTVASGQVMLSAADSPLADAAMRGDLDTVRSLLEEKVDVNAAQGDGTTALHWAAYRDDLELAQSLIKAGANLEAKTRLGDITPLFMASKNGSAAMIELLLEAGADANATNTTTGTSPLMLAAGAGKTDALKVVLAHGVDVNAKDITNGQTALMFAAMLNRGPAVKILAERGADLNLVTKVSRVQPLRRRDNGDRDRDKRTTAMGGNGALHFAAREGQMDAVRELIAAGADVNLLTESDSMSPITQAIVTGHFDIAKFLLDHDADPNLATDGGLTPLFATVDARYAQRTWYPPPLGVVEQEKINYMVLMKELLARGADPNLRLGKKLWFRSFGNSGGPDPAGATAFWRAARAHDVAAMRLLLAAGANPSIPTQHGSTPLQVAVGMHHSNQGGNKVPDARMTTVRYLVEELGADVNSKDDRGYTPLHGAALVGRNNLILYLVANGADVTARANTIGSRGGGDASEVGAGDTVADIANGWSMNQTQYPETVALLMHLGSEFSDTCWASTCVNPTRPDIPGSRDKQ